MHSLAKGRTALDAAMDALLAVIAVRATVVDAPPLDDQVSADPDDQRCDINAATQHAIASVPRDGEPRWRNGLHLLHAAK